MNVLQECGLDTIGEIKEIKASATECLLMGESEKIWISIMEDSCGESSTVVECFVTDDMRDVTDSKVLATINSEIMDIDVSTLDVHYTYFLAFLVIIIYEYFILDC